MNTFVNTSKAVVNFKGNLSKKNPEIAVISFNPSSTTNFEKSQLLKFKRKLKEFGCIKMNVNSYFKFFVTQKKEFIFKLKEILPTEFNVSCFFITEKIWANSLTLTKNKVQVQN